MDPDAVTGAKRSWWLRVKVLHNVKIRYDKFRHESGWSTNDRRRRLAREHDWMRALRERVRTIRDIASRLNAQVMLVDLPGLCRSQPLPSPEVELIVMRLRMSTESCAFYAELKEVETKLFHGLAQELSLGRVDVHGYFERFAGERRLEMFRDRMHMTPRGNEATAEAVVQALGR